MRPVRIADNASREYGTEVNVLKRRRFLPSALGHTLKQRKPVEKSMGEVDEAGRYSHLAVMAQRKLVKILTSALDHAWPLRDHMDLSPRW
jgi:hypothetical protein